MEIVLIVILIVVVIMFAVLLFRQGEQGMPARLDAALKEQFLNFQSNINKDLNSTRQEISHSKDLITEHTVKTIDTLKGMGSTVQKIIQQQEETQKFGESLNDLLQAPKLRGSYGEAILEELLDRVLPKGIWEKQYSIDGQEKVDAIIRLKDTIVPIDAKFPRDDYQKYLKAQNDEERKAHWKSYENAIKTQIKSISEKYIKPEKGTSDFAFMFIPSEAIYYETIADKNHLGEDSKLQEFARKSKVIPVSPNTFYAHLQTVVLGFQNIEILKGAKQLQEGLISVQRNFQLFYKKYEDIGKHLDKAAQAYQIGDSHISKYKRNLENTLSLESFQEEADGLEETTANN